MTNHLTESSAIHWHGIILPTEMDGVPDISYDGIAPGATFRYQFRVKQSGAFWYHSHSGFQEQTGTYGSIIIDPATPDPVSYDREYVVMLSDWSDEDPNNIYATLKKMSGYYNFSERTTGDLIRDIEPITVDEFRIGVAETYDVIVEPKHDRAYCIFAQALDRSGYARGTLTPDPALTIDVPEMDPYPLLTHIDMGMDMAGMSGMDDPLIMPVKRAKTLTTFGLWPGFGSGFKYFL